MSSSDFKRVREIFDQAVELQGEARAAFLDEACAGDSELREKVEGLLAADAELDDFLEPPEGFGLPAGRLKEDAESFLPEEEIGGFRLLRELGRGGRGVVYLAEDSTTGSLVALKVLGGGFLPSAQAIERFRREGRALASLDHPGVVKLVRVGEDPALPYMAIDYVKGRTLGEEIAIQRHHRSGADLPPHLEGKQPILPVDGPERERAIVELVGKIATALVHAHQRLIIHRDLKPQNILLTEEGEPVVIDFGLADKHGEPELTVTGEVEGTPNYMSPEQVRAADGRIDERTDVYSLGVVLYELLTLQRPFDAPTANQVMQNITGTVPPRIRRVAPEVPRQLELICNMAMEKVRDHRYQAMEAFRADLSALILNRPIKAKGPNVVQRLARHAQRRPMPWVAGLAIATTALVSWYATAQFAKAKALRPWKAALEKLDQAAAAGEDLDLSDLLSARQFSLEVRPDGSVDLEQRSAQYFEIGLSGLQDRVGSLFEEGALFPRSYLHFGLRLDGQRVTDTTKVPEKLRSQWSSLGIPAVQHAALDREVLAPRLMFRVLGEAPSVQVTRAEYRALDRLVNAYGPWVPLTECPQANQYFIPPNALLHVRYELDTGQRFECSVLPVETASVRVCIVRTNHEEPLDWVRVDASEVNFNYFNFNPNAEAVMRELEAFEIQRDLISEAEFQRFLQDVGIQLRSPRKIDQFGVEPREDRPAMGIDMELAIAFAAWRGASIPLMMEYAVALLGPDLPDWPAGFDEQAYLQDVESRSRLVRMGEEEFPEWYASSALDLTRNSPFDVSFSGMRFGLSQAYSWTMTPSRREGAETIDMALYCTMGGHFSSTSEFLKRRALSARYSSFTAPQTEYAIRCARRAWLD